MKKQNSIPKNPLLKKIYYILHKPTYIDMYLLFTQLAIFEEAGLTATEYVKMASQTQSNIFIRQALKSISNKINAGITLHESFASENIFDQFAVATIELGSEAGQMPAIYKAIADQYKRQGDLHSKINKALLTPKIGLVMMSLGCCFFVKFFIPKYTEIFANNGLTMPTFVLVFAWIVNSIIDYFPILCLFFFLSYKYFLRFIRKYTLAIDKFLLKVPIYGPLYYNQLQQTLSSNLSLMLKSGFKINNAVQQVVKIVPSICMRKSLNSTLLLLADGKDADIAFEKSNHNNIFSPVTLSLIGAGQKTGRLDIIFEKIAEVYETEINTLLSVIETKLTIIAITPLGAMIVLFYYMSLLPATSYIDKLNK